MYSREHALVGAVTSAAALVPLAGRFALPWLAALFAYGVLLSVFVDLDHFLLARVRTGDWSHLRACLRRPRAALTDQEWIFDDLELERERLLTHALVGGALTAAGALVGPAVGVFTAVVVYVHVLADLLRDLELV